MNRAAFGPCVVAGEEMKSLGCGLMVKGCLLSTKYTKGTKKDGITSAI